MPLSTHIRVTGLPDLPETLTWRVVGLAPDFPPQHRKEATAARVFLASFRGKQTEPTGWS
jgi:hypothetical protein